MIKGYQENQSLSISMDDIFINFFDILYNMDDIFMNIFDILYNMDDIFMNISPMFINLLRISLH